MNTQNEGILNPKPGNPNGYVTKDGVWAAVPWGKKFVIIHNGEQVHTASNYTTAKSYVLKQVKASKKKTSTVEQFFS
jgi:hypothetical protein